MTVLEDKSSPGPRFKIKGYAEISINQIEPHPNNPRPDFHLSDDDPNILALADSIKAIGQTEPGKVYEVPGKTNVYRILQGERRWRACVVSEVPTYRAFIVETPADEAEEYEWLGIEDAFKQSWQKFYILQFAHDLAEKCNISIDSPEMPSKTGLSIKELRAAKKLFLLSKPVLNMCEAYEQALYEQIIANNRTRRTKLGTMEEFGIDEFPIQKAVLTYDIFKALRDNLNHVVKDYSDEEIQLRVAKKAAKRKGASIRELENFLNAIKLTAKVDPPVGIIAQIAKILNTDDKKSVTELNKLAGVQQNTNLTTFIRRGQSLRQNINGMINTRKGLGLDTELLTEVEQEALRLIQSLNEFERFVRRYREMVRG